MEIPSSRNIGCFGFTLDDYLHSYHISCGSSTGCFDLALDCLAKFDKFHVYWDTKDLEKKVRLLKTFYLCVKKCRRRRNREALLKHDQEDKGNIMSESLRLDNICSRIQDVAIRMVHDLQSAYLLYKHSDESSPDIFQNALTRSQENIMLFLEADMKKSCTIIISDYYSPGDPQLAMDLIVFLLETLEHLFKHKWEKLMDTIRQKLMLLRNLIGFVIMRGVECMQLTDLFTHVAIVAERLISVCRFDSSDEQVFNGMESEISLLIHEKINPNDPQVRETYIHVLTASKKQSRSSSALDHEENEYPVVVQFINSLQEYLMDLLGSYASFQVPVKDQMLKLYWGVSCLRILLKQEEKLGDKIKDLIGVTVCDTGIMIFSLSANEIKEGLPQETELGLFHFHNVLKCMMAEVAHNYPLTSPCSSSNYPRSNELGCMDFFLENLEELARCDEADDSIVFPLDRIQMVHEVIIFLRFFLENIKELRHQNEKLQAFWSQVMEATYKAELLIDSTLVGDKCPDSLDAVAKDINLLKIEALEIHNGQTQSFNKISTHIPSQLTAAIHNENLVVLFDELESIIDRLVRGSKQLDVVPIVGMAGLGKTTLANGVYTDPSVRLYFHACAWCCVSQTYSMHNLLVQLLCSISSQSFDEYLEMDENDLSEKLRMVLRTNRYLLVLDDLWDVEAWNLLKTSLPNNDNGSRILITTRLPDLSQQIKPDSQPYHLRHLTDEESWKLLQKKLFDKEGCPPKLIEVGIQIAKACKGLPLTVVLAAGILTTAAQDSWEEIAKSLSSNVLNSEYSMETLELSYSHLPDYLKPCLLYFGAFQEDEVIHVRRMLRLWISEGFVQQTEGKNLEEIAYNYLMVLISRSLVMVIKQNTVNHVISCRVHDLVHEFCVKKAKEENFLNIFLDKEYSTLELSYSNLPDYLKPCLLYFGAFQEDEVINVRRLLWLWISEGFVQQTEGKNLEDAAYDYLVALVNRSLVMVTDQRTMNGAKACQIHDLVRKFCVEKVKEDNFLHIIRSWKEPFSLTGPSNQHRVCVLNTRELKTWEAMLTFPNSRSLLLFGHGNFEEEDSGILLPKLLRVLDLGDLNFRKSFPMEVVLLVHLRYLALRGVTWIPSAIDNLSRLQTLIIKYPCTEIVLPNSIWNIKTLSYLRTTGRTRGFIFPDGNLDVSPDLYHLDTLNLAIDPSSHSLEKILIKLPSIRRLKCMRPYESGQGPRNCDEILVFDCMSQLESLHLIDFPGYGFKFPFNLKKLALCRNSQPWSEISAIWKLPNLEVLKLLEDSFVGEEWAMEEGEFPKLRVLELSCLDICKWTASSDDYFPSLQKLVVDRCRELEVVPSCLGECLTLKMIEVKRCRKPVAYLVREIHEEQMEMGNEHLKIVIEEESNSSEAESIASEAESIPESIPSEAESIPSEAESIPESIPSEAESTPSPR